MKKKRTSTGDIPCTYSLRKYTSCILLTQTAPIACNISPHIITDLRGYCNALFEKLQGYTCRPRTLTVQKAAMQGNRGEGEGVYFVVND